MQELEQLQSSPLSIPAKVVAEPPPDQLCPPLPETVQDTGLAGSTIESLVLKLLYNRGELIGRDLAAAMGLHWSVIQGIMDNYKRLHLVQVKTSLGMGDISGLFALSEQGRAHALQALEYNQYVGPAPVPLYQYSWFVRRQRQADGWLTREALADAYRKVVVSPKILSQIGPAVSSGNSFLIYGQPGNGKTFLAEALVNVDTSYIYIPYAIEAQGQIIQLFDPVYHQPIQDEQQGSIFQYAPKHDQRWFKSRRPFIVTGGELTLDMLDLSYNETSKVYEAPFQLKANNGIYLIDDFGRQRVTPAEVLNRWIVPMERRVDYLSFRSGGKMTVPFEAFLVFSTNLKPDQLGDEAFLRRIQYKMHLRNPEAPEFIEIFEKFCHSRTLPCDHGLAPWFVDRFYRRTGKRFRRCHPRDVLSHAIDLIHFEKLPYELTKDILDRAFESTFVDESEDFES